MELEQIPQILEATRQLYLQDQRPWILGYSGGKDSTMIAQLVFNALQQIPEEKRTKPVYVLSSDTLVETPPIVNFIKTNLEQMNLTAKRLKLPISTHLVRPQVDDTFWVNLIGRGYPAPTRRFRWCTERMKIEPADRFILEQVSKHGEVIVVLGTRRAESATRAQSMALHTIEGSLLKRHSSLANAFVFAPIEYLKTDEVWAYLLQVSNPWGANNHALLSLYRSTQSGECPLVVDTTTPSCGNSRFGCWVCTVVDRDKSMEGMIDSGQSWMEPLLEFRDFLAETGNPEKKHLYRDHKRRGGKISFTEKGDIAYGPFRLDVSKTILKRLLEIQKTVNRSSEKGMELITVGELIEIRKIWRTERQDWEDSVPSIFKQVFGDTIDWSPDDTGSFSAEDRDLLGTLCSEEGISVNMVAKLLDIERQLHGMSRRSSIFQRVDDVLKEDWRDLAEVKAAILTNSVISKKES